MARTRTLTLLRDDVRFVADLENATDRHPDSDLTRLINQAIAAFRDLVTDAGHPYYLTVTNVSISADSSTVSFPSAGDPSLIRVYGVDIQVDGEWRELYPFELSERNKYEGANGSSDTGIPTYYLVDYSSIQLRVIPTADASYTMRMWWLSKHTDLANDADTFDGINGWEDWVVYEVACRLAIRDGNVNDNYEMLAAERSKIEQRIRKAAKKLQNDKPIRRVNTRRRRKELEDANRWHWWHS